MQAHTHRKRGEGNETPHWVDEDAAREIIMQSDDIVLSEDCMAVFVLMLMCGFACLRFLFLHKVFLALTVSGTFPYAEKASRGDQNMSNSLWSFCKLLLNKRI